MVITQSKVYLKRFDLLTVHERQLMALWCQDHLYHGGHYEPDWWVEGNTFYFRNEAEYIMFLLMWT
jgi:hypothetical protein